MLQNLIFRLNLKIVWSRKLKLFIWPLPMAVRGHSYLDDYKNFKTKIRWPPRSFEIIRGHPRSFEAIWGHQRPSEVIKGHTRPTETNWGQLRPSEVRGKNHEIAFNLEAILSFLKVKTEKSGQNVWDIRQKSGILHNVTVDNRIT